MRPAAASDGSASAHVRLDDEAKRARDDLSASREARNQPTPRVPRAAAHAPSHSQRRRSRSRASRDPLTPTPAGGGAAAAASVQGGMSRQDLLAQVQRQQAQLAHMQALLAEQG